MKKGNTFEYMGKNLGPAQLLRPRKRPISTFSFFKFHSNSHVYASFGTWSLIILHSPKGWWFRGLLRAEKTSKEMTMKSFINK